MSIYILILSEFIRNFWLLGKEEESKTGEKDSELGLREAGFEPHDSSLTFTLHAKPATVVAPSSAAVVEWKCPKQRHQTAPSRLLFVRPTFCELFLPLGRHH